jgi:hypothetical protein
VREGCCVSRRNQSKNPVVTREINGELKILIYLLSEKTIPNKLGMGIYSENSNVSRSVIISGNLVHGHF